MPILPDDPVAPLPCAQSHFDRVQEPGFTAYVAQVFPPKRTPRLYPKSTVVIQFSPFDIWNYWNDFSSQICDGLPLPEFREIGSDARS